MGRARKIDDDDDDDGIPVCGRHRAPEQFGPPKPEPHQVEAYFKRLQNILDALEIADIGWDKRMYLQRMLWRPDRLHADNPKRFPPGRDDMVILLLRAIAETTNGTAALTLPVMSAVSNCMHDRWTDRGLVWLEAMDAVPLLEILQTLRHLGLQDRLEDAIPIQTDADPRIAVRTASQKGGQKDGKTTDGVAKDLGRDACPAQGRPAAPSEEAKGGEIGGLAVAANL